MHRLLVAVAVAGCHEAVTLSIVSDRPIPQALDAICVGVADTRATGGQFGRAYRLEGALAALPQTLRVEPGSASEAFAWVRGDLGGVAIQRASAPVSFGGDVTLALDTCAHGPSAAPQPVGAAVGPASARLAASEGPGGVIVIAIGTSASLIGARDKGLAATSAPDLPPGNVVALATGDLDGDCDDDAIVATDGAPPEIWIRDHAEFVDSGVAIGKLPVSAIAIGDVDRDGDLDVIIGRGGTLELYRNDGGAQFTLDTKGALSGGGLLTAVSALALADLDGDGNPELVVGQANAPLEAWLGDPGGTGSFAPSAAIVPAVTLDVERMTLVDSDGDFQPDLALALSGQPMRLLIDRGGHLEDQSFVRLPQPAPAAHAIAIADWDDGCPPDAVIASDAGTPTWRGQQGGMFAAEATTAPGASDVVFTDIDGDGELDAIFATPSGVQWLAR